MAYAPNEADAWDPDVAGTSAAWEKLISNDAQLYTSVSAVQACAYGPFTTGSGGSTYRACYFALPRNYDQQVFSLSFGYSQSGSSSTVLFTVTDGSAVDTGTVTLTASSGTATINVVPSSTSASSTPRYGYIDLTAASGQTFTLSALFVAIAPTGSIGSGVLSSGYISVHSSWYTSGAPVPVGIVQTLRNNPYKIAADRPNAVFSAVQPLTTDARTGIWSTTSSTFADLTRVILPYAPYKRKYRIWCYVDRFNTAKADVLIQLGSTLTVLADNHGIMQATFETDAAGLNFGPAVGNTVKIRMSSGAGAVALRTLQIIEEPS